MKSREIFTKVFLDECIKYTRFLLAIYPVAFIIIGVIAFYNFYHCYYHYCINFRLTSFVWHTHLHGTICINLKSLNIKKNLGPFFILSKQNYNFLSRLI